MKFDFDEVKEKSLDYVLGEMKLPEDLRALGLYRCCLLSESRTGCWILCWDLLRELIQALTSAISTWIPWGNWNNLARALFSAIW